MQARMRQLGVGRAEEWMKETPHFHNLYPQTVTYLQLRNV